jgi:predicted small metal-binding protein
MKRYPIKVKAKRSFIELIKAALSHQRDRHKAYQDQITPEMIERLKKISNGGSGPKEGADDEDSYSVK